MPITNVNYAAEYSQALAQQYPYLSYFAALLAGNNSNRYKSGMGKTMYIPTISVNGARDVNRDAITGNFARNWQNQWQAVELQMDREWDTLVDPMDIDETAGVASIANITRAFVEMQKVPEMDAFIASKLAGFASGFGGTSTTSLTAASILSEWDKGLEYMVNQRINRDRVISYMTPATYKLLKQATGMTRFIEVTNGIRDVDRNIARLDGVTVIEVPDDMMKTAYIFTTGWHVDTVHAQQMNFLLVDPEAVAFPVKYETAMVSAPTAQSKGKYLYYERYYYGGFVLDQRQAGVYAHLGASPSAGTLTVASVASSGTGAAAGDTDISVSGDGIFADGNVMEGLELYYTSGNNSSVSCTYGAALPTDGGVTWAKAAGGKFTLHSQTADKHITCALVNKQLQVVVASGDTTLVVAV